MLDFLKKLFAVGPQSDRHPLDGATRKAQELPNKFESQTVVETPVAPYKVPEPVAITPIPSVVEKAPAKPKAAPKPKAAKAEPKAETTEKPKKTTKLKVAK